jgi:hypothetical protein
LLRDKLSLNLHQQDQIGRLDVIIERVNAAMHNTYQPACC